MRSAVALTSTTLGPSLGATDTLPAQILTGGQGGGLDVGVIAGSLSALHGDTIALGRHRADAAHARVGDRVAVMLGDGTATHATVVAIYTRDLAFGDALLAPELAAGHQTTPLLNEILIQTGQPAAAVAGRLQALAQRYPGLHVSDSASLVTANAASDELNHWLGPFFVAMIFAFTSIAVAQHADHDRAPAPPRAGAAAAHRRHHAPGPVDGALGGHLDHHHRPRHRAGDHGHRAAAAQPRAHRRLPSLRARRLARGDPRRLGAAGPGGPVGTNAAGAAHAAGRGDRDPRVDRARGCAPVESVFGRLDAGAARKTVRRVSFNHLLVDQPQAEIARSAVILGEVHVGAGVILAQGLVVRAHSGAVSFGNYSAVLENGVVIGTPGHPVRVGQRTVFGHRAAIIGATVGDLCEIGNGAILMPGSRLGSGCILGEGTLLPPGTVIPADSVLVGRPPHVIRSATDADRERLAVLRQHQTNLTDYPGTIVSGPMRAGERMGTLYAYRDKIPSIGAGTVLFDSAEITGDVVIGKDTLIGAGVKIIGDSHGPVRIGSRVQILENTVLHLLPDNELIIDDDAVIGPGAMIHGCHIGRGSIVEPGAIVCDGSVVGAESVVRAGACVKQRDRFDDRSILDGFPARLASTLTGPPPRPGWALPPDAVATIRRVQR